MHASGWVLGISSNGDDRMGAKTKTKKQKISRASNKPPQKSLDQKLTNKKSHAEFSSLKNFQKAKHAQVWLYFIRRTTRLEYAETDLESSDCLEYPKISLLKSPNYFRIFLPEKFRHRKFRSQKILRTSPSLEIESMPPRASLLHKTNISHVLIKLVQEIDIKKYKIEEKWQCG